MKSLTEASLPPRMLSTTLARAFFILSTVVLVLFFTVETIFDFKMQKTVLSSKQQFIARGAASSVSNFIKENFRILETAISLTHLDAASEAEQRRILKSLLGLGPAFRRLALLNADNRVLARSSRLSKDLSGQFTDRLKKIPQGSIPPVKRNISPVYIDSVTREPMALLTVPVTDVLGNFKGMLIAELNLKFMWEMVDNLKVGETGYVYVSDKRGNLIACQDTGRIIKGENVSHLKTVSQFIQNPIPVQPKSATRYRGIRGYPVMGTYAPLNTPDWAVVIELPWEKVYQETLQHIAIAVGITLVLAILAGIFGLFIARRLAVPVINLTETASRIAAGERDLKATVEGPKEIVLLAVAFNSMTTQLRQSLKDLEHRFAELKQTEEDLHLSEERLRLALEGTTDGIWDWDLRTGQVYFSPRYYTMMGYHPYEFPPSYESWRQLLHPDDRDLSEKALKRAIEDHHAFEIEFRFKAKNGEWIWILGRGKVVESDKQGKAVRMAGSHTDITKRKEAEEALHTSVEQYRIMTSTSMDGFVIAGSKERLLDVNEAYSRMIGYSREELLKMTILDIEVMHTPDEIRKQYQKTIAGSDRFESRHRRKDGRIIDVEVSMTFLPQTENILIFLRDITERKQAEELLRFSEERLRLALEGTTDGIWDWNLKTGQMYFSPRYYTMLGYNPDEFPPAYESWRRLLHPEDVEPSEKVVQNAIEEHSAFAMEFRFKAKSGEWRWILGRGKVVESDKQGNAVRVAGSHTDITERKQTEAKIRESEEKYRRLFDNSEVLVSVYDREGICQLMNGKVAALFGRNPEDFIGKSLKELHPEVGEEYIRRLRETIDSGISHRYDEQVKFPHYNRWLLTQIQPVPDAQGVFRTVQIISQDITKRKQAEDDLRREKQFSDTLIDSMPGVFYVFDEQGRLVRWNKRLESTTAYFTEEISHMKPADFFGAKEKDYIARKIQEVFTKGEAETEAGLKTKGGRIIPHCFTGLRIFIDGKPHVLGVGLDISDRKRSEEALEKRIVALTMPLDDAESIKFEDLFNIDDIQRLQDEFSSATGVASIITRTDGTFITQPSNYCRLCRDIIQKTEKGLSNCRKSDAMLARLSGEGLVIRPCLGVGLWDAWAIISVGGKHIASWGIGQVRNEAQKEEEIIGYAHEIGVDEAAFRAAYLEVTVMSQEQFESVARMLFELASQISTTAYQNVQQARFIAEHKRADATLRKYERIVSTSQDLMALINTDYVYESVNESFLRSRNKPREEVVGSTVAKVMGEGVFREKIQPQLDRALSGQTAHHQDFFDNPLSGRRIMEVTLFPIMDEIGKVEGVVFNGRDITETRKLEEQLVHSQKIESLGTLAGGVAHEINNPINGIMNYAQLILDRMEKKDPAGEFAREILHETRRVAEIVRNLLTFARHEKQSHSPARFSDIINSVLSLIQTVIRRDQIDLKVEISGDLPKIKCRSQQIQQVLMNLMTNARDALNDRYPEYDPEKRLRIFTEEIMKQGKKFIRTTIEDSGAGIPAAIRDRIFDPFFTTKPKEKGTGLGLSISYGIVKDHGGELSVESEPGQYTRFHMDLPVDN